MKTKQEVVALLVPLLQGYIDNPETLGYDPVLTRCVYLGKNAKGDVVKCIFGACLTDEYLDENLWRMEGKTAQSIMVGISSDDHMFKEEYKGIDTWVWQRCQSIHDSIAEGVGWREVMKKVENLISTINNSTNPGEPITDLGLKFPEVAVN